LLSYVLCLTVTLAAMGVIWWLETPDWKRRAVWSQFAKTPPVRKSAVWIDREVEKFRAEMSRWEHGQA
jgi:hypothetical protein